MSRFVHGEVELAEATGLHVKKIQAARIKNLRQGEHWDLHEQRVAYSPEGLRAVLEKATGAVDPKILPDLIERTRLEKKVTASIDAVIHKFYPNPYRVQIRLPGDELANLKVRSSKNFRPGMAVPVRLGPDGNYELTRREPRFPGRW